VDCLSALLLHVGHAANAIEAALTAIGLVASFVGLGVAVLALWPRRRTPEPGQGRKSGGQLAELRRLRRARNRRHDDASRGT